MDRRPARSRSIVYVIAGIAVVAVAAIVLVIDLRSGDEATPRTEPSSEAPTRVERSPRLPESSERSERSGTPTVSETVVDNAQVRDHRTGARVPYEGRPRDGGVHKDRLPPQLVHDISGKLKSALIECATAIPAEARGLRPGVAGTVFVDIVGETLIVKEASLELKDVSGDPAETARRCVEAAWVGQSTPAGATPETSHYEITVAFALPAR